MKRLIKNTLIAVNSILILSLLSCASAPSNTNNSSEKVSKETTNTENKADDSVVEVVQEVVITPEEEYLSSIENVELKFVETPKETKVGKDFESAYKISVTNNSEPLADYKITITYPSSKNEEGITFTQETVSTDAEGFYSFTPETPKFAANTKINVSLYTELTADEVISAVSEKSISAEYKVKTNTLQKGCLLFVWEFNEKDRATNNFNDLQSSLRIRNISLCGNAPINDKTDIDKSLKTLYKENYEIVEDMYAYLIVGTVKFTKPVEQTEDETGYLCSLVADISAVDMKDGTKVFGQQFTQEAIGSNWTKATTSCKTALAEQIVEALIYGL